MNTEQMKKELIDSFERWYAKTLSTAPDIVPYKNILFDAYVSGAIYSIQLNIRQLDTVFGKPD